jgi:antitoxin (DNA-binding transcriptional repressor) of toxin-antitoxin stability system
MEQVTIEEAQERLADLMAAAAHGETVIIVGADAVPFQIVPLPTTETYLGNDGIRYYLRGVNYWMSPQAPSITRTCRSRRRSGFNPAVPRGRSGCLKTLMHRWMSTAKRPVRFSYAVPARHS